MFVSHLFPPFSHRDHRLFKLRYCFLRGETKPAKVREKSAKEHFSSPNFNTIFQHLLGLKLRRNKLGGKREWNSLIPFWFMLQFNWIQGLKCLKHENQTQDTISSFSHFFSLLNPLSPPLLSLSFSFCNIFGCHSFIRSLETRFRFWNEKFKFVVCSNKISFSKLSSDFVVLYFLLSSCSFSCSKRDVTANILLPLSHTLFFWTFIPSFELFFPILQFQNSIPCTWL